MITTDKEFYSSPYYFFLRDKGKDFSLYFSVESTLSEARKNDEMVKVPKEKVSKVKNYLSKLLKSKAKKNKKQLKGEIEELVGIDGSMTNSKIPILDPKLHPRKTMDQTVAAARITNDPISRGYRTYYGESVEESKETKTDLKGKKCGKCKKGKYVETGLMDDLSGVLHCNKCNHSVERYVKKIEEEDMSAAFGYEETKDMDGEETYDYFKDELDMDSEEAKHRTEQQGKDPSGKRDEKSKYKNDKNFVSRQILPEIQRQKAIKMLEDMLAKKQDSTAADISEKEKEFKVSSLLKKNAKSLLKQMEKEGLSKKDFLKLFDNE